MREAHAAIDLALAAAPDPQRAVTIGCAFCAVTVPFQSAPDMAVIIERKQRQGGCIFADHRICRLTAAQYIAPADPKEIEYVPLKEACYRLGKSEPIAPSERTVLRWAHEPGAVKPRRFGGRWMIAVEQMDDGRWMIAVDLIGEPA